MKMTLENMSKLSATLFQLSLAFYLFAIVYHIDFAYFEYN